MLWKVLLLAGLLLFALFGLHKMIDDDRADLAFPAEEGEE